MENSEPISITTPRKKIRIGDRVTRDDGQLALEVKQRKNVTAFDTITPLEICHQVFGDDGDYLICKRGKFGVEIVQQDVSSFRQTRAS